MMRTAVLMFTLLILLQQSFVLARQSTGDINREAAVRLLSQVPLIDGHNDVPIQYRHRAGYKFSVLDLMETTRLDRPMHTDVNRLRKGQVGAQFWSVYVSPNTPESESVQATLEQIDFVYRMAERYPDHFEVAFSAEDIERIFADDKIASLIGMEGGHSIGNSLGVLRTFYKLGARYMGLTHSRTIDWADSATDDPKSNGLSEFGREVVREMNRLGMLVDLSHVSEQTMIHAIETSAAPVIFSHSSAAAINAHPRNIPDNVLQLVKENNGIVMVTFVPAYISEELRIWMEKRAAENSRLNEIYPDHPDLIDSEMQIWAEQNTAPEATLAQVADHIDHIRNLIGSEYIGIGGDYDGIRSLPIGLEDVSTYPDLFAELLRRGYSDDEIMNIAGRNLLRVFRQAEAVSQRLQMGNEPSELVITDTIAKQDYVDTLPTYPNRHLLVEAVELHERLASQLVFLIDAREEAGDSLIPGAVRFPVVSKLTDPDNPVANHLIGPGAFEQMMREIGLSGNDNVVIYDSGNSLASARLFYALDYYGFSKAAILNGGFAGWLAAGLPVTARPITREAGTFAVDVQEEKFCSFEYVLAASGQSDKIIFDARSEDEFTGADERAAYSGHIPNAVNLEWRKVLEPEGIPYFLPALAIQQQYDALGITRDKEVIPHCHTNVRGSHAYFTLRLMGYDSVRAYEGSWSEYGNREDAVIQKQ
ncbi:MAG: membrane dipeptidase [Cyclonatronaceae bacterium]